MRKLLMLLPLVLAPYSLQAGSISLQTQISIQEKNGAWKVFVSVTNRGDEAAHNVRANVRWGTGESVSEKVQDMLQPGQNRTAILRIQGRPKLPGLYPLFLWMDYTDANGYPFSAIALPIITYRQARPPALLAMLDSAEIAQKDRVSLKIKNTDDQPKNAEAQIYLSKELSAEPRSQTLSLKPYEEKSIAFTLQRFSALPGSTYSIYALIQYESQGYHYCTIAPAMARIVEKKKGWFRSSVVAIALFLVILCWTVYTRLHK